MLKSDSLKTDQLLELTRITTELHTVTNKIDLIRLILDEGTKLSGAIAGCVVLSGDLRGKKSELFPAGVTRGLAGKIHDEIRTRAADGVYACESLEKIPGAEEEGIRFCICFPLAFRNRQSGLFYCFFSEIPPESESRIQGIRLFSDHAATAIGNLLVKEEKEQQIRQLNILNEATISLSAESTMDSLFQGIADHGRYLLRSEAAILIVLRPESREIEEVFLSGGLKRESLNLRKTIGSALSEMLDSRQVLNLCFEDQERETSDLPFSVPGGCCLLAVPLYCSQDTPVGLLVVMNKVGGEVFHSLDMDLLLTYSFQVVLAIENARLHEHTRRLAITDGLTGLLNHREFQNRLEAETRRSERYNRPLALVMIDIDHFKTFNDRFGHQVGDRVLQEVARTIRMLVRDIDIPARYGGEEFVLILPETSYDHAKVVAERIRGTVFEKPFRNESTGEELHITVSIGIAAFPGDAKGREELIMRSDQALYFAKKEGRNRVCRYDETLKSMIETKDDYLEEILIDAKLKVMRDLAAAVDAKNIFTRGHSDEVVHYAVTLAESLNLSPGEIEGVRLAGILHDIGTVSVPEEILNKPGPLNEEEKLIIQGHPEVGEMILRKVSQLESIIPAILSHHERYDGKGYPHGIKGKQIPLTARILAVVEAFQAMTSDRPYRRGLSRERACRELLKQAGKQFDPEIVKVFVNSVRSGHC